MSGITTVVVGHVDRIAHHGALARGVWADRGFIDDGTYGEWANHRRALLWAGVHAAEYGDEHVCIVQDDAVPIDDFRAALDWVVELAPDDMVGLYVGTHRPYRSEVAAACTRADETDAVFLSHPDLLWGVATVLPTRYIPDILVAADKSKRPYDLRLGRAWRTVRGEEKPVLYSWPSLVDHRDEPSVIAGRPKAQGVRVARRVGDPRRQLTATVPDSIVPIETTPVARRRAQVRKNLST